MCRHISAERSNQKTIKIHCIQVALCFSFADTKIHTHTFTCISRYLAVLDYKHKHILIAASNQTATQPSTKIHIVLPGFISTKKMVIRSFNINKTPRLHGGPLPPSHKTYCSNSIMQGGCCYLEQLAVLPILSCPTQLQCGEQLLQSDTASAKRSSTLQGSKMIREEMGDIREQ